MANIINYSGPQGLMKAGSLDYRFTLEFRTWSGSAYQWTDYTDRLDSFGNVGVVVEQNAYPSAFRINLSQVVMDNTDDFFADLEDLDGLLYNSSESYGKSIYKRMLRISQVWEEAGNTRTEVIAIGLVRDVILDGDNGQAIIKVMSLDARAADQRCDAETCNRHPLGDDDETTPSSWTASDPASDTGEVALYQYRQKDDDVDGYDIRWFKFKRIDDIITRTCWALDDLDSDIDTPEIFTTDSREVASIRNIPPDDSTVSTGTGDNRCRALVWNAERDVLVCCVGHYVYDYDVEANTYTLRNTLSSSYQIVRAFYIADEADDSANDHRIVLLQIDVSGHTTRAAQAYVTVLDATGSGAYTVIESNIDIGSDYFPATHQYRDGTWAPNVTTVGCTTGADYGENISGVIPCEVTMDGGSGTPSDNGTYPKDSIFEESTTTGDQIPSDLGRHWMVGQVVNHSVSMGLRWAWDAEHQAAVNYDTAGAKLFFFTWDSGNGYRMRALDLYDYALESHISLNSSSYVPKCIYCTDEGEGDTDLIQCAFMSWDDSSGKNYSTGIWQAYDLDTTSWITSYTYLSGATGTDQAWSLMDIYKYQNGGSWCGILYNRATMEWAFCSGLGSTWAATSGNIEYQGTNRLEGLFNNPNHGTDRMYFFENGTSLTGGDGGHKILYWDGTSLVVANKTPADANAGDPVNTDQAIGCHPVVTGTNFPDANTPLGMMFWISANDWGDYSLTSPAGEYVLCQYANKLSCFVKLLDFSDLSIYELRRLLAEAIGYVVYYQADGTLKFKKREQTTTAVADLSPDNRNYDAVSVQTQGYEALLNDVTVVPYDYHSEAQLSDIVKSGSESSGTMNDVGVVPDPGEKAKWRLVFVTPTTFDLYKLSGDGYSATTAKVSAHSMDTVLRGDAIDDGAYLDIQPDHFTGEFQVGDAFTWWVLHPKEELKQLDYRQRVQQEDATSIAKYQRQRGEFNNRFITRALAYDYAGTILDWRADPHLTLQLTAGNDPTIQPLDVVTVENDRLGLDGSDEFIVVGITRGQDISTCNIIVTKK